MLEVRYSTSAGITLHGTDRSMKLKIPSGWRWFREGGFWFIPRTRDTVQSRARIDNLAKAASESIGVKVDVKYELEEVRPAAEREVDAVERAEARAERLEDRADRLAKEAGARHDAAARVADMIPLGQPILIGHHSEKRHRRDVERIRSGFEKAHELAQEAKAARGAAHSALETVARKEETGPILRRIDRLEADRRRIDRELAGETELRGASELRARGTCANHATCGGFWIIPGSDVLGPPLCRPCAKTAGREGEEDKDGAFACPDGPECADPECAAENERRGVLKIRAATDATKGIRVAGLRDPLYEVKRFPGPQRRAELEVRRAAIVDEVGHLRAKLPADLPGPAKFRAGDLVTTRHGHARVLRVNPKGLTADLLEAPGGNEAFRRIKVPYDDNPRLVGEHPGEKKEPAP